MCSLILTFDCLPRRWLGCYGSLDSTTRGFDRIAALGTIFENAISQDVRQRPDDVAGLSTAADQEDEPVAFLAKGQPLPFAARATKSADFEPAPRRSRKKPVSRLTHELHDATSWLRDQRRPAATWIRHPGLTLSTPPVITSDETPDILARLALIDDELDGFLDEWADCAEPDWTFLITAARGVLRPRPSTRRRGASEIGGLAVTDDLLRVPLLMLEGRGEGFGKRELALFSTRRISEMLADPDRTTAWLRQAQPAEALLVDSDHGRVAVRTADWLFVRSTDTGREPGDGQLFSKPEDTCDAFDVRSTQADAALQLDDLIDRGSAEL